MGKQEILDRLKECIVNLDFEGAQQACREALAAGVPPFEVITEGMAKGLDVVGQKYEAQEYFLSELIVAGEVVKESMKILEPHLKRAEVKRLGKTVLGTVRGDLHDIGKNIVAVLLSGAGFDVIDLGTDVSADEFVEAVRMHEPDIVGMSALLTVTMPEMENVVRELDRAGLRDKVKVIVGGAPLTEEYARRIGADAYAPDAVTGVAICKRWVLRE